MFKHFEKISDRVGYGFESKDALFVSAGKWYCDVREAIDNIDIRDGLARKSRRSFCRSRTVLNLRQRRKLALQEMVSAIK